MTPKTLSPIENFSVSYLGPDLIEGPLPSFFYFALSEQESLTLDPYNQPAAFLASYPMRIFSMTLPGHGGALQEKEAMHFWAQEMARGHFLIEDFLNQCVLAIEKMVEKNWLIPEKCGVGGLSRGAFIASHVAARLPFIRTLLGFAPLTKLSALRTFADVAQHQEVQSLNLENLIDALSDRTIRFYIGNHDTRVGTEHCFQFIAKTAETAYESGIRSSPIELIIGPSIGHMGHGTSKEVFEAGAKWMGEQLGVIHD